MRKIFLMSLSVFMMWACVACGGAMKSDSASKELITGAANNYAMSYDYDSEDASMTMAETNAAMSGDPVSVETGRKLIKEVDMSIETKHFDDFISKLEEEVNNIGGYLENASVGGTSYYSNGDDRSAWFTARVPEEHLESFISQMGENGNVTNVSRNVRDITLEYVDVEGRIESLEAELTRLNELVGQAESLEDILAIESQIYDVRYELESYQSRMNSYNNQIAYSTVSITVWEVAVISSNYNESIWDQIRSGFEESIYGVAEMAREIFVWIITSIPYFVVLGVIVFTVIHLIRRFKRKKEVLRNLAMKCTPETEEVEDKR